MTLNVIFFNVKFEQTLFAVYLKNVPYFTINVSI